MRAGLAVHAVVEDPSANLSTVLDMMGRAAGLGVELVLFPEAALTGLINNDDPAHDLPLGQEIPGRATDAIADLARRTGLWVEIGMLEREGGRLYDSAVLLNPQGDLALHYRRNQPQWHGKKADPAVYRQGSDIPRADTPWGSVAILICGDLFDDGIADRARSLQPDYLLFPFARCFGDGSCSQERWDREELPAYLSRVRAVGTTTLMANYLAGRSLQNDHSFGGAMAVAPDGTVIACLPLGREGILVVDL